MTYEQNTYMVSTGMTDDNPHLAHYGVKGQKHGVRNYQNEDGTLTSEGRAHYGIGQKRASGLNGQKTSGKKEYADKGLIRKWTFGSNNGGYAFAKWRERRHKKNLAKAEQNSNSEKREKKIKKYQSKLDAQGQANRDMADYRKKRSTARLALSPLGGQSYRHARARGSSRIGAVADAVVPFKRMVLDKKKYGKYIVYSDNNDGQNFMIRFKND